MDVKIETSWKEQLQDEFEKPYFKQLVNFVKEAYQQRVIYPPANCIFNAFQHCPFINTKVVILGQDPYHGLGQAHGLSFSVPPGINMPPSLLNIFQELKQDVGKPTPSHGDLTGWAKQGVLLLNATLTVQAKLAGSHQHKGWELFTDAVIQRIATQKQNVVFLLWGAYAQQKANFINPTRHLILKASHPSPFSVHRGFFGSKHFSATNNYLVAHQLTPIHW